MSDIQEYDHGPTKKMRVDVIEKLKVNYAHDNLDEDIFEMRLDKATNTQSSTELISLISDLPDITTGKRGIEDESGSVTINRGQVKESETIIAVMSGSERKGVWNPPKKSQIFAMMGGVDLDYSKAIMPPGITEVKIFCMMGGVDIKVPAGLNVDVSGIPFMGGIDNKAKGVLNPDAPTLKIRAVVIMGGVDVKEAKKKKPGKSRRQELE